VPDPVTPAGRAKISRPAKSAGGGPARTLAARYPGTCACSRSYAKGDKITKVGSGWGHPECAAAFS
jgi:ribonuclease HI